MVADCGESNNKTKGEIREQRDTHMPDRLISEEIVRLAVEACPSGMIMTDADGKIVLVNAEVERLFGYRRDELLGRSIDLLVPRDARCMAAIA